jgi:LacI family transcriptional regulator
VEDAKTADRLASLGLPIIDVAGAYTRPGFRSVTNDDFLTGYQAALHLMGCGFRRFAFLGVSGTKWSNLRREGFERALEQRGLGSAGDSHRLAGDSHHSAAWPVFEQGLAWWEGGRDEEGTLARFLSGLEAPTALFACNDTTGLRATELAGALGIAVPDYLAILGVDNEDILCELASPSLSSIQLDCEAIGYRAAAALDAILEGGASINAGGGLPEGGRLSVPPKEVAERESTRIFACEDELVARAVTFIRAHAQEGIDVSDILAVVSASRRSLEQRFRATMGRSLHEEILRAKIGRAKRLLRETSYPLDRVAEESGFGNLGRFHAAFKEAEGLTPGEWRQGV